MNKVVAKPLIEARFAFTRETKGAWVFAELGDDGMTIEDLKETKIGTLYVRKTAIKGGRPDTITMVITRGDA